MKKINFLIICSIILSVFSSCNGVDVKSPNQRISEKQENFNSEGLTLGKFDNPYSQKELLSIIKNSVEKATWPKIQVTATWGGFGGQLNNPCAGCEHCGCCFGLCFKSTRGARMVYEPLTSDELENNEVQFDFVDIPANDEIILLPNSNIDNGDNYLHIDGNNDFSESVSDYIGREITLKMGSYEIIYNEEYPNGIIVVSTL